jgi:hypothetical protein
MPTATYEYIGSATSTGSSSTLNIGSIPNTYKHLRLIMMLRSSDSRNGGQSVAVWFNGSQGTAYSKLEIYGSSTTIGSFGQYNGGAVEASCFMNGSRSGVFFMNDWWIHDYKATDKYKSSLIRTGGFADTNNSGTSLVTALWTNTSAINQITIQEGGSLPFVAGSSMTLWGVTG